MFYIGRAVRALANTLKFKSQIRRKLDNNIRGIQSYLSLDLNSVTLTKGSASESD